MSNPNNRETAPRRGGWLPRWCGFWASFPLLVLALVGELLFSTVAAAAFLVTGAATRRHYTELLQRTSFPRNQR